MGRAADRERFLRELELYVGAAYNFARWLTGGGDEAEDIVHDALARAMDRWQQYTPGTQMRSWLFTIVRRTFLNRRRREGYEVTSAHYPEREELLPSAPRASEPERLPPGLLRRDLDAALAALTEEQRALIILADVEELTLEEIGGILEIPIGTVKSRLWRARHGLRRRLAGYRVDQR